MYTLKPSCCCNYTKTFRIAYLLVFILLQIARRHQTFWVDIRGDWLNELGVRVHVLHLEERQNVLDFQVVGAVCHGLAFRS